MRKILLAMLFCVNIVCCWAGTEVLGESLYKDTDGSRTRTKALNNQHFTYELKVDALKKLGFRYCIKNFVDDDSSVYYIIKEKLDMPAFFDDKNDDNVIAFFTFVENRSRWNSKQKIDYIYKPFTCLTIYNAKDYDDEAKRIVKKYCKDCK